MRLLIEKNISNEKKIELSNNLTGTYDKEVNYFCYWSGNLNEKHYVSIKSCYYFNILNKSNRKIILYLENNIPNEYNDKISKIAEIKNFEYHSEIKNTIFEKNNFYINFTSSFYSDVVRYLLLYKYGGVWFDLDVFFFRDFSPIFYNYENEVIVYEWEEQNYPNGAIFISLQKENIKLKNAIEFIIKNNRGWGFQEANITYDLNIDFLVLPYIWFDPPWSGYNIKDFFNYNDKKYNFENFYKGIFCFHWHNHWNYVVDENSIFSQLSKIISD